MKKAIASNSTVSFRIDVDFPKADVDLVLKEMTARGVQSIVPSLLTDGAKIKIDKSKLQDTPSEASVNFCLHWLAGFVNREEMCIVSGRTSSRNRTEEKKTELEKLGIEVIDWYGLMQGTCHLNCEVDSKIFSINLVEQANEIVQDIFDKYICYYEED